MPVAYRIARVRPSAMRRLILGSTVVACALLKRSTRAPAVIDTTPTPVVASRYVPAYQSRALTSKPESPETPPRSPPAAGTRPAIVVCVNAPLPPTRQSTRAPPGRQASNRHD